MYIVVNPSFTYIVINQNRNSFDTSAVQTMPRQYRISSLLLRRFFTTIIKTSVRILNHSLYIRLIWQTSQHLFIRKKILIKLKRMFFDDVFELKHAFESLNRFIEVRRGVIRNVLSVHHRFNNNIHINFTMYY